MIAIDSARGISENAYDLGSDGLIDALKRSPVDHFGTPRTHCDVLSRENPSSYASTWANMAAT